MKEFIVRGEISFIKGVTLEVDADGEDEAAYLARRRMIEIYKRDCPAIDMSADGIPSIYVCDVTERNDE